MRSFLIILLLLTVFRQYAQNEPRIKFKRTKDGIYFFPKGELQGDTLQKDRDNIFYFEAPDQIKEGISILVENGQLLSTAADSLLQFRFVPGMRYESIFVCPEARNKKSREENACEFKTLVNGVSSVASPTIVIVLRDKKEELIRNTYIYKK